MNNTKIARVCSCILLLLTCFLHLPAQEISKYYISRHQENGTVYFILEQQGFKNEEASLAYDITYVTNSDTATVNFSLVTKEDFSIDSITLFNNGNKLSSGTSRIYIEYKKEKWNYRYSSRFLFKDLKLFFDAGSPQLILKTSNTPATFSIKKSKWEDQYSIVKKIFALIEHNR